MAERRTGQIEVICGPMFSGKTEELIRRVRRAQIARQRVLVFKPAIDDRYDEVKVVSHSAQAIPSRPIGDAKEIEAALDASPVFVEVVGVDEAQFFDLEIVDILERIADRGARVIAAGLDQDYLGMPFGPIPHLLSVAESITKQLAVCMVCGGPAGRSQRVHKDAARLEGPALEQVLVGATDAYEARCRRCFVRGIDTPSRPIELD